MCFERVTQRFAGRAALCGVDFRLRAGRITALLGANGAGKTTSIWLVTGVQRPVAGTVRVLGGAATDRAIQRRIGLSPQTLSFPRRIQVAEVLGFVAAHHANPLPVAQALERCGLSELAGRQSGGLSGGEQRRLSLACALLGRPELLILDEPTANLDPPGRTLVWQEVARHRAEGRTALLCTHDLHEASELADDVIVLAEGRCVLTGDLAEIAGGREAGALAAAIEEAGGW